MGKDISLAGIFDPAGQALQRGRGVPQAARDATPRPRRSSRPRCGLEGLKRQWGVHAAGVIMSSEPLIDMIPIMKREQDGAIITQFDYPTCEGLGLIKMDFLGLRNLTVLDDALRNIVMNGKDPVVLETLTPGRPARPSSCSAAATPSGVFQLDGGRCGRCCARCGRTSSRTSRPSARCTGPARWG